MTWLNSDANRQCDRALCPPGQLDDFGAPLDRLTAAICAASLGTQLRTVGLGALLAAAHPAAAHWLQPDFLVVLGPSAGGGQRTGRLLRNTTADGQWRPAVTVSIAPGCPPTAVPGPRLAGP